MLSSLHLIFSANRRLLALGLAMLFLSNAGNIYAEEKPAQGKAAVLLAAQPAQNSPMIEIKVRTSGKQIIPGSRPGAIADVTNTSDTPVYLRASDVLFVLAPETQGTVCSCDSWFPNATREDSNVYADGEILCLRPGKSYRAFATCTEECGAQKWYQQYKFISFAPGTYPITVDAKYWKQPSFSGNEYFTAIGSSDAQYAAPRVIILLGAVVGAILFSLLALFRETKSNVNSAGILQMFKAFGKNLHGIVGAALLSVIITILLSRIEEAQSFIRVNISDFWGAIAIGFLANYGGSALLDKMIRRPKDTSHEQTPETQAPDATRSN